MIALAFAIYLVGMVACAIYAGWSDVEEWATVGIIWPVAAPILLADLGIKLLVSLGASLRRRYHP